MANDTGAWLAQQLMRDLGLSPAAASGFAGNLAHESGNFQHLQEINPTVKGSRGGYGWAQWTGPRRRQFESWAASNKLDPSSPEANYGFLKHELTQTPEGRVLKSLQGVNDPTQAARIVSDQFLRPGVPHMESRVQKANQIAGSLGSQVAAQPASTSQAPGTPAPAMGEPINVPSRPIAPQPETPPPGILAAMNAKKPDAGTGAMNPLIQMLMAQADMQQQPQQPPPQMPQQPQGAGLADYIAQYMQSRMV